jgi:putative membrane protein
MIKRFFISWMITTVAVLLAANVVTGIKYDNTTSLFLASLTLGLLNVFLRPVLMALSFSLLLFTLGLFTLVINAGLLILTGKLLQGFHVQDFTAAFWGGLVISLTTLLLNLLTGVNKKPTESVGTKVGWVPPEAVRRERPGPKRDDGPVIDV